jgi:CheY-like chemotaxis protein
VAQSNALVVDDSATSRLMLTKILTRMDIHCEQATSGEEALAQLAQHHPDFVFLDHLMPGMDGFETLRQIKKNPDTRHIPVIMYTSQHAHKYYEEAHALGAAGVISKQIDRDKLYLLLNRICLKSDDEITIPTVYDEVHKSVQSSVDDSSAAKLVARISTLETAYEELHDEHRATRIKLAKNEAELEELRANQNQIAWPQVVIIVFLSAALFGTSFTWFSTQRIEQHYQQSLRQLTTMNQLVDEMVDLLESQSENRKR